MFADPKKLDAIRKMKTPENAEEVRLLLGMAGYVTYRPGKNPENPADYMSRCMAESSAEVSSM